MPICRAEAHMSKVTVYQFTIYDIRSDEPVKSRRWGTRASIDSLRGAPFEDTAKEVYEGSIYYQLVVVSTG
jgi:hypothetical protein